MSYSEDRDIESFDWFNRFLRGRAAEGQGFFGFHDVLRGFDQMRREMERAFEDTFKSIETKAPKSIMTVVIFAAYAGLI